MAHINKLTPEQAAELPALRERWRSVGLCTEPVHPESARKAVRDLYEAGGAAVPKLIIFLPSPLACLLARIVIALGGQLGDQLWDQLRDQLRDQLGGQLRDQLWDQLGDQLWGQLGGQLWDQLRDQLGDQLGDQLWGQLGGQLRDQLWDQLWDQLGDQLRGQLGGQLRDQLWGQLGGQLWDQLRGQLGDQLGDQLWDQLRDQLWDQLWDQLRDQLRGQLGGQLWGQLGGQLFQSTWFAGGQDAFWVAFYEFGERIGAHYGAATKRHFDAYRDYVLRCGWAYLYRPVALVSDRPSELHFDAQRRLHHPHRQAARFRDGWGLFAWHGLRVPARIIQSPFSPETIEQEANAEFRRVLLERSYAAGRTGFELYLDRRQAKVIASDELHGQPRRLLEIVVAGETMRIVEVTNGSLEPDGTRRKFHLGAARVRRGGPLPATPHEAIAASYGINPKHYKEAVRT